MSEILQPYLFPPVSWFLKAASMPVLRIGIAGRFEKQTWCSRYQIAGANSMQLLSVPVLHSGGPKLLAETGIAYAEKWVKEHVTAIRSAYGKAPFFEFYDYRLLPLLEAKPDNLLSLIQQSVSELHRHLLPDIPLLFDETLPVSAEMPEVPPYPQVFDDKFGFRPVVSSLDLLFNLGPEAPDYLAKYAHLA